MRRVSSLFSRKIHGLRLPLDAQQMQVQRRARSVVPAIEHCEMEDMNSKSDQARPYEDIPGPKKLPVIGNVFRFLPFVGEYYNVDMARQLHMLHERYGDIVKLEGIPGRRPCVFLFTPELSQRMHRVEGTWPLRIAMETLHYYRTKRPDTYGEHIGLATGQGKAWHDFRTKVNQHMMQPRTIRAHVTQISEVTGEFVEKLRGMRDPVTLELPNYINNEMYKWALEAICAIGLNCRLGCLKPNLAADSEPQIMINNVHTMFDLMYRLEIMPSMWKLYNTRNLKKLFSALDTLNRIASKHIENAKAKFRESTSDASTAESSILEKLLRIDENIAHTMALDMITAGIDTTGNTAGGLLYNIATNPDKQEKLREEVMSVLPDKTSPVTPDVIERTKYSKACMKESLRLFSIALGTLRTMSTDVTIAGYRIPKGCDVIACSSVMAVDPTLYPRPQEYIPERWLRGNTEFPSARTAHPFSYLPFGFGVRTCIGRRFAEMELETLLLTVIRNFRLEWHHEPMKYKSRFINTMARPLRLKLIDL